MKILILFVVFALGLQSCYTINCRPKMSKHKKMINKKLKKEYNYKPYKLR